MLCGRNGCACTTCQECGYDYPCICKYRQLRDRTYGFLNNLSQESEALLSETSQAMLVKTCELLREWADAVD